MIQTVATQTEITTTLKLLNSSIANDLNGLSLKFNKFLQIEQPYLITFMNYQFFSSDNNLITFLTNSLKNEMKSDEDVRKIIYAFIADYVTMFKDYVGDYLTAIFDKMCAFFKMETAFRPKIECLGPIREILVNFPPNDIASFINPKEYHKSLTYLLKVDSKMTMTVKGQIWVIVGILQNKFASSISYTDKKDVQIACLMQLKELVKKNENFTTIACILRSFAYSLSENYLDPALLEQLFTYTKTIMIPLAETYGASIAALELIIAQSMLFHPYIMKHAISLFKTLTGLMGHQNKQYKFTVLDTLAIIAKQIVIGISSNIEDPKMVEIFNFIGNTMWTMLKQQTEYSTSNTVNDEKNRFYSSVISIVKILGTLSPLILNINGKRDLKRFFSELLKICNRKVIRAFEQVQVGSGITKKIHVMKLILYNQKELVSFISSFAKILQHLQEIQQLEALSLEQLFLVGVRQYPFYLQKYIPDLVEAMVHFLMGLYTKPHIFTPWCKKLVLISLMESLDAKRFNINTDHDYYQMIKKSSNLWRSILTHTSWKAQIRKQFSNIVFDTLQHLFLNLDISYKTSMELDLQNQQQQRLKQQQLQLVNIFFMSDENLQMSNIADYQYVSSLSLIFNELMLNVDTFLYTQRVYGFYEQIIYRIKIFPKSIPLMKVIRSLNCFIVKNNWFEDENRNSKENRELLLVLANFFKFCSENIYKLQENYFYEALKMLMSMPLRVYLLEDCNILKNTLGGIISKSLQLGQQIITLAYQTIKCLSNLFKNAKQESVIYLCQCIPYLQKYINFTKNSESKKSPNEPTCQQKQQVRSYLFLYQININRKDISVDVMKFLGSIGGISHMMIQNSTKDYISWDYYCKLDLTVIMGGENVDINLTKLLARTCWLMQHGTELQKVVSSQFMHAIMVYTIGRAAFRVQVQQSAQESKENLSNFFDRVLPTILAVSSNQSHPCQQLMHTLTIQTIHFLANTQDSNSPDIQTLLKNLISLYTGAEDLSFLASKCLSELVKWHIKQAPQVPNYPFPLVKTVIRNVWSLISNKKARNGLIQFLIKFLKAIHRHAKLMSIYAIELCSLIISMGRSDRQIQPLLDYLVKKYILAIGPYIKSLILQQDSRRFRKLSTLQKLIQWIYNNSLFSIHKQQRTISYTLWQQILTKYGNSFNCNMQPLSSSLPNPNHNIQVFLSQNCDRELKYLFSQNRPISINEEEPKLEKQLPKITAFGEIWGRIVDRRVFQVGKLIKFRDFQEVYLESFCSFLEYFCGCFCRLPPAARIIPYQTQKCILDCLLTFINLYLNLSLTNNHTTITSHLSHHLPLPLPLSQKPSSKDHNLIQILLKLVFKPNSLFPNFNYDLIYECAENVKDKNEVEKQKDNQNVRKELQQGYYFGRICGFVGAVLGDGLLTAVQAYIRREFKIQNIRDLIPYIVQEATYYDREIKCVLSALTIFANSVEKDNEVFCSVLKNTLEVTVSQIEQSNKKSIHDTSAPKKSTISNEKKSLLIWYLLQHSQHYSIIHDFLVAVIKNDTIIYQKYQKNIMKSVIANWQNIGQKIITLVLKNHQFLKLVFILCKVLPTDKKNNLYSLIQKYLVGIGLDKEEGTMIMMKSMDKEEAFKRRAQAISQMLKICFYFVENWEVYQFISGEFQDYVYGLICQGMDVVYSLDIHQQSLNLAGLSIRQNSNSMTDCNKHAQFIQKYRKNLSKLTTFYLPNKLSKISSSDSRNNCVNYLKIFKSMVILSNDIKYLQFIFLLLKDRNLETYYSDFIQDLLSQCLGLCYEVAGVAKQYQDLMWMNRFYWEVGLDNDCWANIRVVFVDQIMRKAIKMTKQQVLIKFFQQQAQKLLTNCIKTPLSPTTPIKQLILQLQLKRVAFGILQQLYSHLPKKQKNTEDLYKKQLHKQIIKYCNENLKPKTTEISMTAQQIQVMLREYDRRVGEEEKEKMVILKSDKNQPKLRAIDYLKKYYCGAYNCLIVLFISTQSNKAHFQTYLFESKGSLWKKLVDEQQQDFNFQIETSFAIMQPISKINKKLNKKIKDKYWQSSLYAIEQEYVPASLIENVPENQAPQPEPDNNQNNRENGESQKLELDHINKHPCMINLLRVIDFMHEKFYDGTLPGWMKPIHDELSADTCPLSIRILLTKLIINRPKIFTQSIWAEILLKYLTLKQNGGKFIHYYFRDVLKHYLSFLSPAYKPNPGPQIPLLIMKLIKALPHQNLYIYTDNMQMLNSLLKIEGVWINKSTVVSMLKANEKAKPDVKLKFQWRMCIAMVLKCCMEYRVPVVEEAEVGVVMGRGENVLSKFRFYYDMRREGWINLIFQMAGESVKKYRIAASGFLGQLLKFVIGSPVDQLQQEQLIKVIAKFLSNMNMQQSNRNSKQKFSLCILNVATRFPAIVDDIRVYGQIQTSLSIYCKQERLQILQTVTQYTRYIIQKNKGASGYLRNIFMTIRSIIINLLNDIQQVQSCLINLLYECCRHEILINKQIIQTYYYIYDELQRIYGNSMNEKDSLNFYKIVIAIKDFTYDPDLPKTKEITMLSQKAGRSLLRGLGSQHQEIRKLLFQEFERGCRDYGDSAERMLDILVKMYDVQHENLWLINVVPLIFSLVKQSSDYTRLRFEKPLADVTSYYDWDFRKNLKAYNSSQPFTPAFTLSTGALVRRPDGTVEPSFNPTMGGQKLKGIIRASQNSYMSQQQQVFTILASQSDYQASFEPSLNSESPSTGYNRSSQEQGNKITKLFTNMKKRRNKNMQEFKQSNLKKNAYVSMIDNNRIRFNKKMDKNGYEGADNQSFIINTGSKKISVRKYKVGELPDIQISTQDLMDPMIYLAGCDHQFASELFILIFIRICMNSRKEKKEKFKQTICKLLKSSASHEYNFISTLEKCLICLCHNLKEKIDFSMKEIATKSSTLDYAIVFTEENQIQTLRQPDFQNEEAWRSKVDQIWGDLVDLYQQINEEDLIYGVLIRLATGDQRKLLLEALNLKKLGNIKKSQQFLNAALTETNSRRIKQFIGKQKIDCSTILGDWQSVTIQMNRKLQMPTQSSSQKEKLSINEQKILTIALQNTKIEDKMEFLKKIVFHQTKCQYEKAILQMLFQKGYDAAYIHLQKSIGYFSEEWKKISSFAFNSKHGLLEQVQKKFQLQQFLQLYRKDEIQKSEYEDLFAKWSNRQPNSVYDSNLTFLQILQSRRMFADLLSQKFKIDEKFSIRSTIDWLIQMANGMVEKGVLGGAETLIKKALICKRKEKEFFIWDFYDSVAKLKLKQLMTQKNRAFSEYEIVANLVKKQMDISHSQINELQKLKFISLKNTLFQAYISSCLSSQKNINTADFINKVQLIFTNYNEIRKNLKLNIFQASSVKQFEKYRREMFFKFTLFLEKILAFVGDKTGYPDIKDSMVAKNYKPERLSHLFVEMLFTSIQYSDFSSTMGNLEQNMVLSLIMKLIKIIQMYPTQVGEYFADTISNKRIPVWIFLYFIPQMIKFINNPNLVPYFQDLFRSIANLYPEALVYHFNCSYELQKDQSTPFCRELNAYLRQKMSINYRFIDALVLLQYPQIRLRESLNRFLSYQFQRENSLLELKQLIQDNQYLGKYNKKFVQDWQSKISRIINKIKSNDLSVLNDIKIVLSNLDPSNRETGANLVSVMRDFVKVSDGSLFYEEYNSNDWARIQIPGTSYRKFQEPKPWKKVFIESFDHSLLTLQSKQKPRRITVYGSNEKKYMLLVKTGEDVRLDQRIEEMFEIMNRILKENSDCSKKQLQIRRFEVTPIKKMMGIFEWVDQSQTLKEFLETQFKIIKETDKVNFKDKNRAFQCRMEFLNKLSPNGLGNKDPNHQHKALLSANKPDVVKCFIQCQRQIPYGLLRRALQRLSKNYDSFLHIKNSFIANYALISCVTYILGIGDRHLENFLIHMGSASVVPIDFGFSFGASFELGVPELMPFRLTKSFQELMDPIGQEGVFKKSMISSFEAFSENVTLISDYCQVFVDDPLIQWIWSNKKNVSQSKNVQFSSSQDPPEKAHFAQKVLSVRKKLEGCNPRMLFENMLKNSRHKHANYAKILSDAIWGQSKNRQKNLNISDVVEELISMATDKNILGRTYIGWNPYV